jgi:TPR repeat protein
MNTLTLKAKAALNDPEAMAELGFRYMHGNGVSMDNQKAFTLLKRSSEKGSVRGTFYLGLFYEFKRSDNADALKYYERAAMAGHPDAQRNSADLYFAGEGIPRNYERAVDWYHKAAGNGVPEAQFVLGEFYRTGSHVEQSPDFALVWYREAAKGNYEPAKARINQYFPDGSFNGNAKPSSAVSEEWKNHITSDGSDRTSRWIEPKDVAQPNEESQQKQCKNSLDAIIAEAKRQGWLRDDFGYIPELLNIYTPASKYFMDLLLKTEPEMQETMKYEICRYLFAKGVEGVILWGLSNDGKISVNFHPKHLTEEIETEVPKHLHELVVQSRSVGETLFWAYNRFMLKQQEAGADLNCHEEALNVLRWIPKLGISYALFKEFHQLDSEPA